MMISIKRLLDRSQAAPDAGPDIAVRLRQLLEGAIVSRRPTKRELGAPNFQAISRNLLNRLEQASTPLEVASIATDALDASEDYTGRATEFFDEHSRQIQAMVTMLTETVSDLTGQSDESVARLHGIERRIEQASGLDDIRSLKESLAGCLAEVKEFAVQQKKATQATVEKLRDHIKSSPQSPIEPAAAVPGRGKAVADYVATFQLQHADHILKRFGELARDQMLLIIGEGLKTVQGPDDRLMRWKGPSYVMFLSSSESLLGIRRKLSATVAKISQRYVELGKNSAMLAVGVDWVVFPQKQYDSLDVVFEEVDSFLTKLVGK